MEDFVRKGNYDDVKFLCENKCPNGPYHCYYTVLNDDPDMLDCLLKHNYPFWNTMEICMIMELVIKK